MAITGVDSISILNLSVEMYSARILKQSMGARNRVGIGFRTGLAGYYTALAELVPWNRFLGTLKVKKFKNSTPHHASACAALQ